MANDKAKVPGWNLESTPLPSGESAAESKGIVEEKRAELNANAEGEAKLEAAKAELNARGAADLVFFNGTSSEIHIHLAGNEVIAISPMQSKTIPREAADAWLKTRVGQAYVEAGLLKTREVDEMDFSSFSDLTPPKTLTEPATAGNIVATVESRTAEAGTLK